MRMPRVRFTVRRLMIAVAVVAFLYRPVAYLLSTPEPTSSTGGGCGMPILDPIPGELQSPTHARMVTSPH
jgi:hypothetical protein